MKRDPRSGAPGIGVKKSAGAPSLNPTTYKSNYLDVNVAARHHRERLENKLNGFTNQELTPVKKRRGLPS